MPHLGSLTHPYVLAAIYVAIPNAREIHIVVTNTTWHLALAAALVGFASSPRTWRGRLFEERAWTEAGLICTHRAAALCQQWNDCDNALTLDDFGNFEEDPVRIRGTRKDFLPAQGWSNFVRAQVQRRCFRLPALRQLVGNLRHGRHGGCIQLIELGKVLE
jgi:hypothetical protein